MHIYRSKTEWIFNFCIYGERHSGTTFLNESISKRFNIPSTGFFGHKHYMGFAKPETIAYERHTLFLGILRHPYDWLLALYNLPHNIPHHNRNNYCSFLLNEYYSIDTNLSEIMIDRNFMTKEKRRYKNIFELRSSKLMYLNEMMPILSSNYALLTYEELVKNNKNVLNLIENRFDLKKIGESPPTRPIYNRGFPEPLFKQIIDENIDWEMEEKIGYYPK